MIAKTPPNPFFWLTSDKALPYLDQAARTLAENPGGLVRLATQLRKELSAEQAHLVLEQVEMRQRAREKFSAAERMFFTPKSLMQASDERIAACKARRFPDNLPIADLCCGIGGDLLALAMRGECVGVERDEVLAHLAERNCQVCGREGGRVEVADAADYPLQDFAAWHIDPDRRPAGKRTTQLEFQEPPREVLQRLLQQNPNACIKLAPAADIPEAWERDGEREWLESRGECRQQVVWLGALAVRPGACAATIVDAQAGPRTVQGRGEGPVPIANHLSRYVYDPAAAVLAARLTHVLCGEHLLAAVSSKAMYLTGNDLIDDAALSAFEVIATLPMDERQLKAALRERGIGRVEVKKRGCHVEPERLQKSLAGSGDETAALLVCPMGGKVQAILTKRVSY